jgi:hypothetical protein
MSFVIDSDIGLSGFSRKPMVAVLGTNSCNSVSPLAKFTGEPVGARQVASGPIEACNKPKLHRVGGDAEHNWDAGGRSFSGESSKRPGCDDHSDLKSDKISHQRWQSVSLVSRPAIFNHKVPAFNVAGLVQTPPKAGQPGSIGLWRPGV